MQNMYENMYQNRGALVREEIRRTRHRSRLFCGILSFRRS